ncbi:MAG: glycosyltransferase [Candidatus Omnitrophica bacterium]|nr:glycosyltransferase [Candidatus Omnitrophota bacterium]
MSEEYFISVIIPAYNCAQKIEKCINALLDQDYPKDRFEIIVVDNNSKDGTAEAIKKYPVKYLLQDKIQTSYASRNKGIEDAKGDIIAFTDSDCVPLQSWLSEGIKGFSEEHVGCVAGGIQADTPQNYIEEFLANKNTLAQSATMNNVFLPYPQTANAFYRAVVFNEIGLFEEKWVTGGDADLAWRMQLQTPYKIKYMQEAIVLHKHRSTLKSMFAQKMKWGIGRTNLYRKYKDKMKGRRIKETWWDLQTLLSLLGKVIKCHMGYQRSKCPEKERQESVLIFLNYAGDKLGELIGSIKNGVYYV